MATLTIQGKETELSRRLDEARALRQLFEQAYDRAQRIRSYEASDAALAAAKQYTSALDGIIAAHVRMIITQ